MYSRWSTVFCDGGPPKGTLRWWEELIRLARFAVMINKKAGISSCFVQAQLYKNKAVNSCSFLDQLFGSLTFWQYTKEVKSMTCMSLYRYQYVFQIMETEDKDRPVVTGRCVRLWFSDGPLSGLSTAFGWSLLLRLPPVLGLPPVHRLPPPRSAANWCALCGDAGLRPAGGQFPVVLVIYIQQLSWTAAQTEGTDGRTLAGQTLCLRTDSGHNIWCQVPLRC